MTELYKQDERLKLGQKKKSDCSDVQKKVFASCSCVKDATDRGLFGGST